MGCCCHRTVITCRNTSPDPLFCQVALLFLSRGAMPLEPAWREFLEAAALIEPVAPQQYIAMCAACLHKAFSVASDLVGVTVNGACRSGRYGRKATPWLSFAYSASTPSDAGRQRPRRISKNTKLACRLRA